MKSLSTQLQALINSDLTLATCWRFSRTDGVVDRVTNYVYDITEGGEIYLANAGFTRTDLNSSIGLSVDNHDIIGYFDSEVFTDDDLRAGRYNGADVEIFMVNYLVPEDGRIPLSVGTLGRTKILDGRFVIEFRSISQLLDNPIGQFYGPYCRFKFGSPAIDPVTGKPGCGVSVALTTVTGTITSTAEPRRAFTDSGRGEPARWFAGGEVTFTSGLNDALTRIVKSSGASGQIEVVERLPFDVQIGDTYTMHAGCNHLFKMAGDPEEGPYTGDCLTKHNNGARFGGEPESLAAALQFGGLS